MERRAHFNRRLAGNTYSDGFASGTDKGVRDFLHWHGSLQMLFLSKDVLSGREELIVTYYSLPVLKGVRTLPQNSHPNSC
jgi:hypothetical protein